MDSLETEVLLKKFGNRAELGVDGNCGFALLGTDIQEGEAEFVEIDYDADIKCHGRNKNSVAERLAISKAFKNLKKRLGVELTYWIGKGHPSNR